MAVERDFLIGLSGSGTSTAGKLAAERLGWAFADSDRLIEEREGRTIPEIFGADGEAAFRRLEAAVLAELVHERRIVIATGGGAPTDRRSQAALAEGLIVWLDVTPEHAARRLLAAGNEDRPLLQDERGLRLDVVGLAAKLHLMRQARLGAYERSDRVVAVDYYPPDGVAERIVELVLATPAASPARFDPPDAASTVKVRTKSATREYEIVVQAGGLARAGEVCRRLGLKGRAFLLSDSGVAPLYGGPARASLEAAGFVVMEHTFAAGEAQKNLATVEAVYDWLLAQRVERSDFLVCLGGGVVTDLGGYVAATVLRGIDFVHIPTTLLGMVDAAVGGKTGVDHPRGKNLVGAFAQPRAVIVDPDVLRSLDRRLRVEGLAELLKHGLILDAGLWRELETIAGDVAAASTPHFIARSVAIKAAVVSEDEREADLRALLNYGHTVGHAIESVAGYGVYLHGEAVAIGMRAAGLISVGIGLLSPDEFDRQQRVLTAYGLPERATDLDAGLVLEATKSDKKVRGGSVRWVLLERIGEAVVRADVPAGLVQEAIQAVMA